MWPFLNFSGSKELQLTNLKRWLDSRGMCWLESIAFLSDLSVVKYSLQNLTMSDLDRTGYCAFSQYDGKSKSKSEEQDILKIGP